MEDIAAFGRWIDLQAGKANDCEINGIRFENVNVNSTWLVEGEVHGMNEANPIRGLEFSGVRIAGRLMDRPEIGGLSLIHTAGTKIEGKTFADKTLPPQPIPNSVAHMATRQVHSNKTSRGESLSRSQSVLTKAANLLTNPDFADGLEGWTLPQEGTGIVKVLSSGTHKAVRISERNDSTIGLSQDVTEILQEQGPGNYLYGVVAKAINEPLHMKATLIIEDEAGLHQHPSPDVVIDAESYRTASRMQPLTWASLERATLRVESGYGDKQDVLVQEVFLKK